MESFPWTRQCWTISSVQKLDIVLITSSQEQWTIGRDGEKESGNSMLSVRLDDDDHHHHHIDLYLWFSLWIFLFIYLRNFLQVCLSVCLSVLVDIINQLCWYLPVCLSLWMSIFSGNTYALVCVYICMYDIPFLSIKLSTELFMAKTSFLNTLMSVCSFIS